MRHPLKILLTACLMLLLSDLGAMVSGKPFRKIGDNWEERSAIRPYIKRKYLEVTPASCEVLHNYALNPYYKEMIARFNEGVAVKWPGSVLFDETKISSILIALQSATKFRVSIEGEISDESSLEFIWDCLQGLSKIQEMDLSGCGLTNRGVDYVMDSVGNPKGLTRLDLRRNHLTAEIAPVIRKRFPKLEELEMDESSNALKGVPTGALVPQGSAGLKTGAPERLLRAGPEIPVIARGYEAIYLQFLNGKLIYRPDPESEEGKIELPIRDLANPLGGEFDLSLCGDTGKYCSINTGYRKGKKAANKDKREIWFAPRFLIERELSTTAGHFKGIMTAEKWPEAAPIGIFWTWGDWDDLEFYDYLTNQGPEQLNQDKLLCAYVQAVPLGLPRSSGPQNPGGFQDLYDYQVCF